ncbi:unnamed protein product [Closterium sp. NIES-54]
MHSRLLVSSLPRSLPPLPPLPALPCLPCVEGRQRAAPHSSFPRRLLPCRLSTWTSGAKPASVDRVLRELFHQDLPVLRRHPDRGGEFSSNLLRDFCRGEGILQTFLLPDSPQQNGIAERRIGLVMEVARTSMIHAAAPHFLWPFAVRYAAHQLNLWPCVSLPETSPTLRWTGEVGDESVFRCTQSTLGYGDGSPLVKPAPPPPPVVTPSPSPLKQTPTERAEANEHGPDNALYGRNGSGGQDLQPASMRAHQVSSRHHDCIDRQKGLLDKLAAQKKINDYERADPEGARVTRLMRSIQFVCDEDAPIAMFPMLVKFLVKEGVSDIPQQTYGVYITQYGCMEMVKAMCTYQQQHQLMYIHASPWIGISCDGSTDRSCGKHLVVFATFMKERAVVT